MWLIDIILLTFGFGLPVVVLTWYLFLRLYDAGELDRNLDRRELGPHLKALKKQSKNEETRSTHLIHNRWMRFGGGFYGLAALWTFAVIEVTDLASFLWNFPGFAALFEDGVLSFLIKAFINQIQNFVAAIVWFLYWGQEGNRILIAPVVGYLSYLLGMRLARQNITLDRFRLKTFARNLLTPRDPD